MAFDTLLGNDRLKQNLAESLAKDHISHFYLISGPKGSGKKTLATLLAQAILCRGSRKPCGTCDPCRKIANGNHPDFITVEDPEHKNVAVKIVRAFRSGDQIEVGNTALCQTFRQILLQPVVAQQGVKTHKSSVQCKRQSAKCKVVVCLRH